MARQIGVLLHRLHMMYPWLCLLVLVGTVAKATEDYPFRNTSLPWDDRVNDLLGRLTLDEVIAQSMTIHKEPVPGIPRLGVDPYIYITECLTGQPSTNTTSYPQPIGMAATFSPDLVQQMAEYISTEARAIWNENKRRGVYLVENGLSCFSPVVNIMRHPLWGRNQETFGEDPYLSGEFARSYVHGLQGSDSRIIRTNAGCKHFDVYGGPENIPVSRLSFDAKVSMRDWRMTFLPAFKACVDAGTFSFMCSFNSINGIPACANKQLLTKIARDEWGFQGYVASDHAAVSNIMDTFHYCDNVTCVVKAAMTAGCNLEVASFAYNNSRKAISEGLVTENLVRKNIKPMLYTRMRLGEFDPPSMNPYANISMSEVQKETHRELSITLAAKSFVLLKNEGNLLPVKLKNGTFLAVVGPFANSNLDKIYGKYASEVTWKYAKTPYQGLAPLTNHSVTAAGCTNAKCDDYNSTAIKEAVTGAMLTVVCLGTGTDIEQEAEDRSDLDLPGQQLDLLMDVVKYASGGPVILLLFNAGPLDVTWAKLSPGVSAILACSFPAQPTGDALYRTFTGKGDGGVPAARLPVTWPAYLHQVPPITDYGMDGHTYRYYHGEPLYPFGYGLSYSEFMYTHLDAPDTVTIGQDLVVHVGVMNIGAYHAEEVVQLYLTWDNKTLPAPSIQLVGFQRVDLKINEEKMVNFTVTAQQMSLWINDTSGFQEVPGPMTIYAGGQQPNQVTRISSNVLQHQFKITKKQKPFQFRHMPAMGPQRDVL